MKVVVAALLVVGCGRPAARDPARGPIEHAEPVGAAPVDAPPPCPALATIDGAFLEPGRSARAEVTLCTRPTGTEATRSTLVLRVADTSVAVAEWDSGHEPEAWTYEGVLRDRRGLDGFVFRSDVGPVELARVVRIVEHAAEVTWEARGGRVSTRFSMDESELEVTICDGGGDPCPSARTVIVTLEGGRAVTR